MNRLKRFIQHSILVTLCTLTMAVPCLVTASAAAMPVPSFADSISDACAGIGAAGGDCGKGSNAGANGVSSVIKTLVNLLSAIVGVAAVIVIIVAGLKYVTSGGDTSNVSAAKNTIIYAVVGLIVVALAQVIVHFVWGAVS